jgi:GT2 family glycosyltransferase
MMDHGDPRVAVVMITHNRREEVLRTLGEIARLPERPRTVVVDNGSTDGTAAAVAERYPSVEVLHAGGNLGASGRTLGLLHVHAPYVAFCDDDSWWKPGALRRAADQFDAHPRLGLVTGRILVGPEGQDDPICEELRRSPLPRDPGMPGPPVLGFLACATVVRRSAYLEAGGFNARILVGGEEQWLAADLASRSWWLCYVPEIVVHHHPSVLRDRHSRRWQEIRNALWFAWLRRPWPSALGRTIRLARTVPHDRASLRGFAAAFAGLPWVLRQRRVVSPEVERLLRMLDVPQPAAKLPQERVPLAGRS